MDKRIERILLFCAVPFFMGSCKKDYSCTCISSCGDGVVKHSFQSKEKDAEEVCHTFEAHSGGCLSNCVIK